MKRNHDLKEIINLSEEISLGVFVYSKDGGIIYANGRILKIFKTKEEDFLGFKFMHSLGEEEKVELIKYATLAFNGQTKDLPWPVELNLSKDKIGKSIRFYPQVIKINQKQCIVGFVVDITEENNVKNNKIANSYEKDNSISSLLDEFNNLLTGILGYSSLLRLKEKEKDRIDIINKIYNTTMKASRILDTVLLINNNNLKMSKEYFLIASKDNVSVVKLRNILKKQKYSSITIDKNEIIHGTMANIEKAKGVFVDIFTQGINTFGYISDILNYKNNVPIILMAHERELKEVQDIIDIHDVYFLQKPVKEGNILNLIKLIERS